LLKMKVHRGGCFAQLNTTNTNNDDNDEYGDDDNDSDNIVQ